MKKIKTFLNVNIFTLSRYTTLIDQSALKSTHQHFNQLFINRDIPGMLELYKQMLSLPTKPDSICCSYVMRALLSNGQLLDAYKIYLHLNKHSILLPSVAYDELIITLIKTGNIQKAWEIFNRLRKQLKSHIPLSPSTYHQFMLSFGKQRQAERAFKLYREMTQDNVVPNIETLHTLVYVCSKRKDYFRECFSLVKQLEDSGFSPTLTTYNWMLHSCARVSDLQTGKLIWEKISSTLSPDPHSFAGMFWLLASIETNQNAKSINRIRYPSISSNDICREAKDIYSLIHGKYSNIPITAPLMASYLAVFTSHLDKQESEAIFYEMYPKHHPQLPISFQHMFEMYDTLHDYQSSISLKRYADIKGYMKQIPFLGWRALIRTAASNNQLDDALEYLEEMKRITQYTPTVDSLKLVLFRCIEMEDWNNKSKLLSLCAPIPKKTSRYSLWNERMNRINALLDMVYGKPAGKGFLRGIHANMKGPGASFDDQCNNASDFKVIEQEFK